jgi:hypothetical protein
VPAFRRALTSALERANDAGSDLCGFGGAAALAIPNPKPAVQIVKGEWCTRLTAYCAAGFRSGHDHGPDNSHRAFSR